MSEITQAEAVDLAMRGLRLLRDDALAASDWTQIGDSPLSAEDKAAWGGYRTYLRDLPSNTDNDGALAFQGVQSFEDWGA